MCKVQIVPNLSRDIIVGAGRKEHKWLLAKKCAVKGAGLQRVKLPPGNWFAPPVAIEAAAEATKLSELSMERVAWRLGERAGHNS
jgi:hypothetical protein